MVGKKSSGLFFSPTISKNALKQITTECFQITQKNFKQNNRNIELHIRCRWFALMLQLEKRNERICVLKKPHNMTV